MTRTPSRFFPLRAVVVVLALALAGLVSCAGNAPLGYEQEITSGSHATLAILETTDIHSNILSYDYYKLDEDPSLGFERTATLVKQARAEFPNTVLFDAGDTIQGTPLADYQARVDPVACNEEHAMYRAMDAIGYDGGTIGNHEFNYGLPFLAQVTNDPMNVAGVTPHQCKGPVFPLVLSNVFSTKDDQPIFPPTAVIERTLAVRDAHGRTLKSKIRIGIIGFTPPGIMQWDKGNLDGKVYTKGVVEAAQQFVPQLRAQNVDIVVAISHGGLDTRAYSNTMENANWYLAGVPGIDVLLLGHSHTAFPDPHNLKSRFNDMPEVDNVRGFVRGKPAVMGDFWGKGLGVIELGLVRHDGHWLIDPATTHSQVRSIRRPDGSAVAADPAIAALVEKTHEATIKYVSTPIGDSDFAMTTYFADVGDVTALQPVNMAQRDFVQRYIADNLREDANIPVLSAAAPFKAGFGGPTDYTDVPAGPLAIRSAADLYLFPNTLSAVRVDGTELKAWLERAAGRFNRIDPSAKSPQALINPKFPSYNFDVIQGGLSYAIDVTRPYGERIVDLRHAGQPVDAGQTFIVATNNYRANGGGHFPGIDGSNMVLASADDNREVLIDWVRRHPHLTRAQDGSDRSWRFVPVATKGPVTFHCIAAKLDLAHDAGIDFVQLMRDNGDGIPTCHLDLAHAH